MTLLPLACVDGSGRELEGAELRFDPHWIPRAAAAVLLTRLRKEIPWEVHRIRMFGREVDSPRLSCWIGDADACYRYSGAQFEPRSWPASLLPLRQQLRDQLGVEFNSVLANLYRDGRDSMGWHSDDERELGPQPVIASLSLGQSRRFLLRARTDASRKCALELEAGSLLVMQGQTQQVCTHSLSRTARATGERLNLTFRRIVS